MRFQYIVSSALAACLVLLAACGGAEVPASPSPPESPVSVSEAPPEAASPAAPAPEAGASEPASRSEPEPPALTPAPGVEVRTLLTWEPGSRRIEIPFPARNGRLVVEVYGKEYSDSAILGFDLETGEAEADFVSMRGESGKSWDLRQAFDEEWAFKSFSADGYSHTGWSQGGEGYTLPNYFLKEGKAVSLKDRKMYGGGWDWDAQPEKDLLTWTSPEGLWLAAADGSGARLVLTAGDVIKQPKFAFLAEENQNLPIEAALTFQCPRLMNGGKSIVVDFDLPGSPTGHIGLAVLNLATGRAAWYDPFANPLWGGLEYLDDVTVQAGTLQINVAAGKTKEVTRHIQVGEPYWVATTGDFSRYFACDKEEGLAVFLPSADLEPETALTAAGYQKLSLCHAIDTRRVICEYEIPGEAGLLLVTIPKT